MTARRLTVLLLLPSCALAGSLWVLLATDTFTVRRVTVTGTRSLDPVAVAEAAGIAVGGRLVTLDTRASAGRVTLLPRVRSATVVRRWPDTVRITIVERAPLAVTRESGQWLFVDEAGVTFPGAQSGAGLPVLSADGPAARQAAAATIAALPEWLAPEVSRVTAASAHSVRLSLADGVTVIWGGADEADRKGAVLAVLRRLPARVYDVSTPQIATITR